MKRVAESVLGSGALSKEDLTLSLPFSPRIIESLAGIEAGTLTVDDGDDYDFDLK